MPVPMAVRIMSTDPRMVVGGGEAVGSRARPEGVPSWELLLYSR